MAILRQFLMRLLTTAITLFGVAVIVFVVVYVWRSGYPPKKASDKKASDKKAREKKDVAKKVAGK